MVAKTTGWNLSLRRVLIGFAATGASLLLTASAGAQTPAQNRASDAASPVTEAVEILRETAGSFMEEGSRMRIENGGRCLQAAKRYSCRAARRGSARQRVRSAAMPAPA